MQSRYILESVSNPKTFGQNIDQIVERKFRRRATSAVCQMLVMLFCRRKVLGNDGVGE